MKKISKIGLSALCSSLAVISTANAGDMKVTGAAHITHTSKSGLVTGQPLGMKTNLSFIGSGELDGGQDFSVTIAHTDQNTWSSANITLNLNSLGTWKLSAAEGGGGIGGYDDNMPRAWEEVWDSGSGTSVNLQKGVGSSTNLSYTTPKAFATTLQLAWAPENDGTQPNDKSVGGSNGSNTYGQGADAVLNIAPTFGALGFNLFVGASVTEQEEVDTTFQVKTGDHEEGVAGLVIDLGPISVGGQVSAENTHNSRVGQVEYYGNASIGVALNINDDLSISYGDHRSMQTMINQPNGATGVTMDSDSWQVAYTIGGVALKYAKTEVTNVAYTRNTAAESDVFSLSMAF